MSNGTCRIVCYVIAALVGLAFIAGMGGFWGWILGIVFFALAAWLLPTLVCTGVADAKGGAKAVAPTPGAPDGGAMPRPAPPAPSEPPASTPEPNAPNRLQTAAPAAPVGATTASASAAAPSSGGGHWTGGVASDSGRASAGRGQSALQPTAMLTEEATLRDGVGAWRYGAAPAVAAASPEPAPAATAEAAPEAAEAEESAPRTMDAAPEGGGDDLTKINGVGPKLAGTLHELGFYTFAQIAEWGPAEIAWVDNRLSFKGRIERDDWVSQAQELAKG